MTPLEQIQQDLQTLPPEALTLVGQFIQLLKKNFPTWHPSPPADEIVPPETAKTPNTEKNSDDWSDFIGCMSAEEDLSVNYKNYWGAGLEEKYGYR